MPSSLFPSADETEIFGSKVDDLNNQKPTGSPKHPMIFSLKYADRKVFMKTAPNASRNEIHEWLYAIDPLMAGEIKYVPFLIACQKKHQNTIILLLGLLTK